MAGLRYVEYASYVSPLSICALFAAYNWILAMVILSPQARRSEGVSAWTVVVASKMRDPRMEMRA